MQLYGSALDSDVQYIESFEKIQFEIWTRPEPHKFCNWKLNPEPHRNGAAPRHNYAMNNNNKKLNQYAFFYSTHILFVTAY
jgi:hypothetical protein